MEGEKKTTCTLWHPLFLGWQAADVSRRRQHPQVALTSRNRNVVLHFSLSELWALWAYTHSLCNRSIISFGDCASRPIDMWVAWGQSPLYKNIFRSFVCLILAIQIAPGKEKKGRKKNTLFIFFSLWPASVQIEWVGGGWRWGECSPAPEKSCVIKVMRRPPKEKIPPRVCFLTLHTSLR